MSSDFYCAFENRFRGPRELIKSRLRVYLPFVEPLKTLYNPANVIDLGCGRGEWLELMREAGLNAVGVDLDAEMLAVCIEAGFSVEQDDAVSFMSGLPSESQAVVTAFQVVEHLSFDQLKGVVSEAQRVLKPGGLLIMETPNPENIVVATRDFYLDPTHQRPIPPQLLSFLSEYYSFNRVKILRLQEPEELAGREAVTLLDVLEGASPDYAVVAQKPADQAIMNLFNEAFDREYGISIEELNKRYGVNAQQIQLETIQMVKEVALQAEARRQQQEQLVVAAEVRCQQLEQRAVAAEGLVQQKEKRATAAEAWGQQQEQRAVAAAADLDLARTECAVADARLEILEQDNQRWMATANHRWEEMMELQDRVVQQLLHSQSLQNELDLAHAKAAELSQSSHHWWTVADQRSKELASLQERLAQLQAHSQYLESGWHTDRMKAHHWWTVADNLNGELQATYASSSWRITLPLRWTSLFFKQTLSILGSGFKSFGLLCKKALKSKVIAVVAMVYARPGMKRVAKMLVNRAPAIETRLRRFAADNGIVRPTDSHANVVLNNSVKPPMSPKAHPASGEVSADSRVGSVDDLFDAAAIARVSAIIHGGGEG